MGKIIYTKQGAAGDVNYIAGTVTGVREGTGDMEGKVVNVGLAIKVKNADGKYETAYVNVGYFNKEGGTAAQQMADRVKRAKLHAGSFILATVGSMKDGGTSADGKARYNCTGFAFNYTGVVTIDSGKVDAEGNKRLYNVFVGPVQRVNERDDKMYVDLWLPMYNRETRTTDRVNFSVEFTDSDKRKLFTQGKKAIKAGVPVAIMTGAITDREGNNGHVFHNANALAFEVGPAPAPKAE